MSRQLEDLLMKTYVRRESYVSTFNLNTEQVDRTVVEVASKTTVGVFVILSVTGELQKIWDLLEARIESDSSPKVASLLGLLTNKGLRSQIGGVVTIESFLDDPSVCAVVSQDRYEAVTSTYLRSPCLFRH